MTDLLLPPEVTDQLDWQDCPNCKGEGRISVFSSITHGVDGCPQCRSTGRVLAPRQVVALPETLTVPCPQRCFENTLPDILNPVTHVAGRPCPTCGGTGRVPLPDGIYQLTTECSTCGGTGSADRSSSHPSQPCNCHTGTLPLGSPVRVTHVDWEEVWRYSVEDQEWIESLPPYRRPAVPGRMPLRPDVYDRLAARPHAGGVLLVEEET